MSEAAVHRNLVWRMQKVNVYLKVVYIKLSDINRVCNKLMCNLMLVGWHGGHSYNILVI